MTWQQSDWLLSQGGNVAWQKKLLRRKCRGVLVNIAGGRGGLYLRCRARARSAGGDTPSRGWRTTRGRRWSPSGRTGRRGRRRGRARTARRPPDALRRRSGRHAGPGEAARGWPRRRRPGPTCAGPGGGRCCARPASSAGNSNARRWGRDANALACHTRAFGEHGDTFTRGSWSLRTEWSRRSLLQPCFTLWFPPTLRLSFFLLLYWVLDGVATLLLLATSLDCGRSNLSSCSCASPRSCLPTSCSCFYRPATVTDRSTSPGTRSFGAQVDVAELSQRAKRVKLFIGRRPFLSVTRWRLSKSA